MSTPPNSSSVWRKVLTTGASLGSRLRTSLSTRSRDEAIMLAANTTAAQTKIRR